MNKEQKAWFINQDYRKPSTLYIMYDSESNEPWLHVHFMQGKEVEIKNNIIFDVENTKWAKPEHILKWDFLPNSARIPLANEKAVKVLEEVAPGQFQAIPTELRMPDGSLIKDYKLINITRLVNGVDFNKSVLNERNLTSKLITMRYKWFYHHRNCLDGLQIARDYDCHSVIYGSEKLRKAVKANKLTGMTFKDTYAGCHQFIEE